jgi:hypothetical protein
MVPLNYKLKILSLLSEASTSRHNKVKLSLSKPWRRIGGQEVQLHSFLTSALGEGAELNAPVAPRGGGELPVPTD